MNKSIKINRPPLVETYDLPTREALLAVKVGDHVKLVFEDASGAERMWVIVKQLFSGTVWNGVLDNDPLAIKMKVGEKVSFHPLDVIDILSQTQKKNAK